MSFPFGNAPGVPASPGFQGSSASTSTATGSTFSLGGLTVGGSPNPAGLGSPNPQLWIVGGLALAALIVAVRR